ncbi:hypothetical protein [Dactylosporangium sp. NPDC051541]|uniref:hypothetical protein n=1 Tax=Dactylosporangium sp. NPDC051541 TaxID=3363977 RepID=UPI00378B2950
MATTVVERPAVRRPLSSDRRDLVVALAAVWLTAGLFMDGWAHSHVPSLETFFTPWHGVLYSGYAALAIALVPARLWRGRPPGPVSAWLPAGYGLGLLGAVAFAFGGACDMLWHITFGIEVDLEALLSPPHLLLLTAGALMIATPIRAAAAKGAPQSVYTAAQTPIRAATATGTPQGAYAAAPDPIGAAATTGGQRGVHAAVLIAATCGTAIAAFFLDYLSPFTDAPAADSGYGNGQPFGLAEYLVYSLLIIVAVLFTWSRLRYLPVGLVTLVVAAASLPNGVFDDFENLAAQLWPLLGAVVADLAVQAVAARWPRFVPLAVGVLVPFTVWPTHLIGVQMSLGVAWSLELWSGVIVLTMLAGAAVGGLFLPREGSAIDGRDG